MGTADHLTLMRLFPYIGPGGAGRKEGEVESNQVGVRVGV